MGRTDFDGSEAMAKLVTELLSGKVLTAKSIAQLLGVGIAAAQRKLQALLLIDGAVRERSGRAVAVKFPTLLPRDSIGGIDVASACLVSSFASTLRETSLAQPIRGLVDRLAKSNRKYVGAADLDRKFWFVVRGGEAALPSRYGDLVEVVEALLANKRIRFDYEHFDGHTDQISTRPLTLAIHDHQFYVICWNETEPRYYPYRFARMANVKLGAGFHYPQSSEYNPPVIFRDAFGIFIAQSGSPELIRLRLDKKWQRYAGVHRWHESQQVSNNEDGSVEVRLTVRVCPELKRWVLWFGSEAEVLEPIDLRQWVAAELAKASGVYPRSPGVAAAKRPRAQPRKVRDGDNKKRPQRRLRTGSA